jgi:hypothetical protein
LNSSYIPLILLSDELPRLLGRLFRAW